MTEIATENTPSAHDDVAHPTPTAAESVATSSDSADSASSPGPRARGRRRAAGAAPRSPQGGPARSPREAGAPRAAHAVLERLFELYPRMFGARFLPLKLGVYQELLALHADEFKKDDLKVALGLHARSTRYLESVASGEPRHDLQGQPVEPVAPEHVHHAIMEVFRRRQARSREDLSPWLHGRLVKAIEASGLSREDYVLRVPTPDPRAAAALDAAFAALASQAARREALVRAYKASGRTVEEFADMYGMSVVSVQEALAGEAAPATSAVGAAS